MNKHQNYFIIIFKKNIIFNFFNFYVLVNLYDKYYLILTFIFIILFIKLFSFIIYFLIYEIINFFYKSNNFISYFSYDNILFINPYLSYQVKYYSYIVFKLVSLKIILNIKAKFLLHYLPNF